MPELKNLFIKGKMNKDLDERLVPQGEYRDALNVSVSYSEGSDVGALQNILGNTERVGGLTFPSGATCIGTVRDTENDKIYWFGTSATADYIAELDPSDNSVDIILCDTGSILNFSTSNLITGVAVLDGVLYFTDDLNEPRQVDIEYWRGVTATDFTTSTNLSDDRISLYKKGPLNAPTFHTLSQSIRTGSGTLGGTQITVSKNFNNIDIDDTFSGFFSSAPNYNQGDIIELKHTYFENFIKKIKSTIRIELTVYTSGTSFTGKLLSKTKKVKDGVVVYDALLEEDEPLFDLKFALFSYRYKYTNGQYSVLAPFSLPAFIPGEFSFDAKKGFNLGMKNTVRKIELKGWGSEIGTASTGKITLTNNNYAADIEEIDILYKDSVSANVYIADTLKLDDNGKFDEIIEIKDEQVFKALQSNQILRPFDSIPRKAKALEITGNRIIFGNYLQNFNYNLSPNFTVSLIDRTNTDQNLSIKSGRTYQVGIVFQDKFGRQTPVFTNKSGIIKKSFQNSAEKQALQVSVTTTAPAEATHYKYYIKEISNPYYNLVISGLYEDPTGFIYLALPTSEINKVSDEDVIILKKGVDNNVYSLPNNKFKILDKSGEPPSFLNKRIEVVKTIDGVIFAAAGFGTNQASDDGVRRPGITPCAGHNRIQIQDAKLSTEGNTTVTNDSVIAELQNGRKIRFRKEGTRKVTELYTISAIQEDNDADEVELTFKEEFGSEVEDLYDYVSSQYKYQNPVIEIIDEKDLNLAEYSGKFFIKIDNSTQLKGALEELVDEDALSTIATHGKERAGNGGGLDQEFDSGDNRGYFISHDASAGTTLSGNISVTGISTDLTGFHIVVETSENYLDSESYYTNDDFNLGLTQGNYIRFSAISGQSENVAELPNYRIEEVIIVDGNNKRSWCLRLNKNLVTSLPPSNSTEFIMDVREFNLNKNQQPDNPPIFEVEPKEGVLEIYYETQKTYEIAQLSNPKELPYANCISFANGVESDRIRDDFNAPTIGKGVRVSTVFEDNYKEERVKSGLIFSQIYNGKNGINRLNQFIIAENITEEANPIYGSIQKLNTRDTDLTLLCDDAILKVPARKDLLFQADGNAQLTSTDRFLGTIIPYQGNYGCQHPESFADHIYRAYFVDRTRGKVLRLGGDGITEISNYGMKDYFKDKLVAETGYMFGSYDENKDQYNISLPVENTVVAFSESVNGWPTRKSFHEMESGISLNNMYYTFKDGKIFSHDNETRNTFYSTKTDSEVTFYLNGNPGNAKNFRTLNYQGDSGWISSNISTDKQSGNVSSFVEKEGIYYNYISGNAQATKASLDLKALNVQGLGTPTSISSNDATFTDLNNAIQIGDIVYDNTMLGTDTGKTVTAISGNTITLDSAPANAFSYFVKDNRFNTSGILGYYAEITMTNTATNKKELYSVGSEVSLSS